MSLNAHLMMPGFYDDGRYKALLDLVSSHDIVCLQEVYGTLSNRLRHIQEAPFTNLAQSSKLPIMSFKLFDSGLCILSKFPILSCTEIPYSTGQFPDSLSNKGFQHAVIQIGSHQLHVINTHLQADYDPSDQQSHSVKVQQVNQLLEYIQLNHLEDAWVVGDFNLDTFNSTLHQTWSPKMSNWNDAGPSEPTHADQRLDYIWIPHHVNILSQQRIDTLHMTDHYGVSVTVRL